MCIFKIPLVSQDKVVFWLDSWIFNNTKMQLFYKTICNTVMEML